MNAGTVGIGSIALGVAIALYVLKKRGKLLMVLMVITGIAATPLLSGLLRPVLGIAGGLGVQIAIPTVLAALGTAWICLQWKSGAGHKATPWLALITPSFWGAAGGIFATIAVQGQTMLSQFGGGLH